MQADNTDRRGGGEALVALEEIGDILRSTSDIERIEESKEIIESINRFLETLTKTERGVFMHRYWMMDPVAIIASTYGMSLSKASSMLHRLRQRLRKHFEKEGIYL